MFLPLTKAEIKTIGGLVLKKLHKNLAKQELKMELTDSAMDLLADLGYDPQFGARPLKRVIEKEIVNPLSKLVLSGTFVAGETIYIGTDPKGFTFSEEKNESTSKPTSAPKEKAQKRAKQVDKVMKAAKDVEDAVKDIAKDQPKKKDNKKKGKQDNGEAKTDPDS